MEKNYYISGYTGFCPDMAHRIGQNYTESTREAIREQPHLRGRLGDTGWHEMQKGGCTYRNREGFEFAYDAMPDYAPGYTGHIPTNLWTSCKGDGERYDNARCPLKAYPLSCSEYGSPCLDNRCSDDNNSMCSGQGFGFNNNMFLNVPHGEFRRSQNHEDNKSSKSCCSSCSKGGQCEGERRSQYSVPKKSSKACCSSCSKGGLCESDRRNIYKLSKQASKACCNSCAQGNACESDRRSQYSRASFCSSGSRGNSNRNKTSCSTFKFRNVGGKAYRKCGVIPNYMGHIPGLQMTYGEPYGITANRLLQRHFNEQENRNF